MLVAVLVYAYLAGLFGWLAIHLAFHDRLWWVFLAGSFGACLFAPLPLAFVAALATHRADLLTGCAAALAVFLFLYGGLFLPRRASVQAGRSFSVLTYNVMAVRRQAPQLIAALRASGADVIALQELNPRLASALAQQLVAAYPYQLLDPRSTASGMGLLSRYPLRVMNEQLPGAWLGTPQLATLDVAGAAITIINIHNVSLPTGGSNWQAQAVAVDPAARRAGAPHRRLHAGPPWPVHRRGRLQHHRPERGVPHPHVGVGRQLARARLRARPHLPRWLITGRNAAFATGNTFAAVARAHRLCISHARPRRRRRAHRPVGWRVGPPAPDRAVGASSRTTPKRSAAETRNSNRHRHTMQARPRSSALVRVQNLVGLAVASALAAAYLRTAAPSVTWANGGADSGDLVTAAATFGAAHPTGYPTYLLLTRLFMLLPFGELAFRATLLSAACGVAASLCVGSLARRLLALPPTRTQFTTETQRHRERLKQGWAEALAAGLATLALGLSPLLWSQAVIPEVYALNALFVALILHWLLDATIGVPLAPWAARARPIAMGLMLGNHVTIALPIAAWALASLAATPPDTRLRWLARSLSWGAAGLLVYAYLPLAARGDPPVNWGDPRGWAGFWSVVSGQLYRGLAFGLPPERLGARISAGSALLAAQFGWAGLVLALGGLVYAPPGQRGFAALSALVALGYALFAIGYASDDSDAYLLPAFLILAVWLGAGVGGLLRLVRARWRHAPLLLVPLAALLLWNAPATLADVDASQDRGATNYADAVMRAAPHGALVVTSGDLDTFPLWYYRHALGRRRDVRVVVESLLGFPWYRATLRATYGLRVPDAADDWLEAIVAENASLGPLCRADVERAPPLTCE